MACDNYIEASYFQQRCFIKTLFCLPEGCFKNVKKMLYCQEISTGALKTLKWYHYLTSSSIDMILTNYEHNFIKLQALLTKISDFHVPHLLVWESRFTKVIQRLDFLKVLKILIKNCLKVSLVIPCSHFNC